MKYNRTILGFALVMSLTVYADAAGKAKRYSRAGKEVIKVAPIDQGNTAGDPADTNVIMPAPTVNGSGGGPAPDKGGRPNDVEGPLTDKISEQGVLYGDLYVILRYRGGEIKKVPKVDENGDPVYVMKIWIGPDGFPVLDTNGNPIWVERQAWDTAIAVGGEPVLTENYVDYTIVAEDTGEMEINPLTGDIWFTSPTPSQCVQPLADYRRWGSIGTPFNTIPLVMTYDPTWDRTEAAVGTVESPTYFVQPGDSWEDPNNGVVTYEEGVMWSELVKEVSFGRLNSARSPAAVRQAAFDEAISSINQAIEIRIDASGRLLLTKEVYDEYLVDPATGAPLFLYTYDKAIDSPLENMALYVKLMRDGHLVTPGNERGPIDRSERGGIPLDKMLELEDGPSSSLRPTIDIQKLRDWGLGHLVDVDEVTYYTYYEVVMQGGEIVDYVLHASTTPPASGEYETWVGIPTSDGSAPADYDFEFCASTLAAAADKSGKMTIDHLVYLNSILGINKVVGTSEDGAIDYSKNPQFFSFGGMPDYNRAVVFNSRGYYEPDSGGGGDPAIYSGYVVVLQTPIGGSGDPAGDWMECEVPIMGDGSLEGILFRELGTDVWGIPNGETAVSDIAGFAQATDDDLRLIDFVHTYQIPENR